VSTNSPKRRPFGRKVKALVGALTLVGGTALMALGTAGTAGAHPTSEDDNHHPSGQDRSVEPGGSGTQGKSPSDPDGESNGGEDKTGGEGGEHLDDQDGNNGCGNDDDFEDDNNGNCGGFGPQGPPEGTTLEDEAEVRDVILERDEAEVDVVDVEQEQADVLGVSFERQPAQAAVESPQAEVLGATQERSPLAATGMSSLAPLGFAVLLIGTGTAAIGVSRRRSG
jgi:hypothetical protein